MSTDFASQEVSDIETECEGSRAAALLLIADWLEDPAGEGWHYSQHQRRLLRKHFIELGFYEAYEDEKCHYYSCTLSTNRTIRTVSKFGYFDKPDFKMNGVLYRRCKSMQEDLLNEHEKQFG